MEFKMSAFTKLASVAITVTLGIASNVPLSNPALSASSKSTSAEHVGPISRGPVVDFGLYYGPHIEFRHSKEGTTRGTGKNTLYLVSQIERRIA
jgi:hypothetical protein